MASTHLPVTKSNRLINFLPLPRCLLGREIPGTALLIFGLLLDRTTLSRKHGYQDEAGWLYVFYPQSELAHTLGISLTSVKDNLKRLEKEGLIRRTRQRQREASRIFLLAPEEAVTDTPTGTFPAPRGRKSGSGRESCPAATNVTNQKDIIYDYQLREGSL